MSVFINDQSLVNKLNSQMARLRRDNQDSFERLSSGQVFTTNDPRPADQALATGLEYKLRSLAAAKRGINDAVSLVDTASGGLAEINNMVVRMQEINVASASNTVSDRERQFLFTEYQALYDEIDRIAHNTEYNGLPLLNATRDRFPDDMSLRIGLPSFDDHDDDVNLIKLDSLTNIVATAAQLGLKNVRSLLADAGSSGISLGDARDLLESDDSDYHTPFEQALNLVAGFRANLGAIQNRLQSATSFTDVFAENIAAARSRIADTDYADEVSRLTQGKILMQATTSLLSQSNLGGHLALELVQNLLR